MQQDAPIDLNNKAVLITGGTTGIGRATAIALAKAGARTFVFGRDHRHLEDALKDIPNGRGVRADTARRQDIDRVFGAFQEELGDIDILIDNAALSADGIADASEDDWRYAIEADFTAYLAFAREAGKRMRKRGGDIVLVGSISAESRGKDSSIYVAAKAGVQGFAESFAKEMAPHKVRVSLIEPGTVGTDMQGKPEAQRLKIAKHEMLMAEDVADTICFMLTRPQRVNLSAVTIIPRLQHEAD